MDKIIISESFKMKNGLDDDYTLYEDGTVLHFYDRNIYPGGQNLKKILSVDDLSDSIKQRILSDTKEENKELARRILKIS
jgi:hypothetical protein